MEAALELAAPLAAAGPLAWLGLVVAAGAAAGALVLGRSRRRAVVMLVALALVPVLLVGELWDSEQFRDLRDSPLLLAILAALGVGIVAALAAAFVRWPDALPVALIAVLPFRVPLEAGGSTANLLIPLYLVLAAGVIAAAVRELAPAGTLSAAGEEGDRRGADGRGAEGAAAPRTLAWLLAAALVLYALQSAYSNDLESALKTIAFFLVPFALMFRLLADANWSRRVLTVTLAVVVVEALLFVGVGFWEYRARELLWNPKVINANQFEEFFRVNSVFWDPNIYARYLGVVIVLVVAVMLWARETRHVLGAAVVAALLWGGLVLTFSQSGFAALLAGLAALAALRWSLRATAIAALAALAGAVVLLVAFGDTVRVDVGSSASLNASSSGRTKLIGGGLELAADRPLTGYGSGSFQRTYRREDKGGSIQAVAASHTEPVTVAAEQGVVGLALYAALVGAGVATLVHGIAALAPGVGRRRARGDPGERIRQDGGQDDRVPAIARVGLIAAFVALLLHTLAYAAFLSDPITWVLLALGSALATGEMAYVRAAGRERPTLGAEPVRSPA